MYASSFAAKKAGYAIAMAQEINECLFYQPSIRFFL
jgi:hypothetical protein